VLSWTHYRILTQVEDTAARQWYEKEAYDQVWSTTTLQRNVSSQYYYRILKSLDKQTVEDEMKELTSSYQNKFMFSLK
jgi:predicted nuclease of restriction endonuclease-like (RecB) superfamily